MEGLCANMSPHRPRCWPTQPDDSKHLDRHVSVCGCRSRACNAAVSVDLLSALNVELALTVPGIVGWNDAAALDFLKPDCRSTAGARRSFIQLYTAWACHVGRLAWVKQRRCRLACWEAAADSGRDTVKPRATSFSHDAGCRLPQAHSPSQHIQTSPSCSSRLFLRQTPCTPLEPLSSAFASLHFYCQRSSRSRGSSTAGE